MGFQTLGLRGLGLGGLGYNVSGIEGFLVGFKDKVSRLKRLSVSGFDISELFRL